MKIKGAQGNGEHFAWHWLTIQPSLFGFLEDEIGELDENQKLFVRVVESIDLERIAAKYHWRGNGRKLSSRPSIFKLFLMKHVCNFPTSKEALAEARRSPSVRRLCGWETMYDVPSESTVSRAFDDFATDEVAQGLFRDFVSKVTVGRIVLHRSIDSTEIDAREKAATKEEKSQAESDAAIRAQVEANADDYNALSLQCGRDKSANLALLPKLCDWGCKRNSNPRLFRGARTRADHRREPEARREAG